MTFNKNAQLTVRLKNAGSQFKLTDENITENYIKELKN